MSGKASNNKAAIKWLMYMYAFCEYVSEITTSPLYFPKKLELYVAFTILLCYVLLVICAHSYNMFYIM